MKPADARRADLHPAITELPVTLSDDLAAEVAALHAHSFPDEPWTRGALRALLAMPGALLLVAGKETLDALILLRRAGEEAEVIALAVRRGARRRGLGRRMLDEGLRRMAVAGVRQIFLEVAEDNSVARALYRSLGFVEVGRRRAYYRRRGAARMDALVLRHDVPVVGEEL